MAAPTPTAAPGCEAPPVPQLLTHAPPPAPSPPKKTKKTRRPPAATAGCDDLPDSELEAIEPPPLNDVFFGTSDVLPAVPALPAVPEPPLVNDPQCEAWNPPLPPYKYRQPWDGTTDRTFRYTPGPARAIEQGELGLDEEGQGSLGTSLQLAALGPQNYVLDLHPQMTFFRPGFQRHTAFASECFEDDASCAFGSTATIEIQKRGDMLGDMCLELTLPDLGVAGGHWADAIGYVALERLRLKADDVVLEDHERLWLDLADRLFMPHGRLRAVDAMIRRTGAPTLPTNAAHVVHVPLKFFCCKAHHRSPQALPLVSLVNRTRLVLEVRTAPLAACLTPAAAAGLSRSAAATARLGVRLLTHQHFVDQDEQRAALHQTANIMIDAVQDMEALSYVFDDRGRSDVDYAVVDLAEVNLPVKSLAFVAYDETDAAAGTYFRYLDCVESAVLQFGSSDRFAARGGDYFSLQQTYAHAPRCTPDRVHLYSFALQPGERQPSGALNFAAVERPVLRIRLKNAAGVPVKLKVFALCTNWVVVAQRAVSVLFA